MTQTTKNRRSTIWWMVAGVVGLGLVVLLAWSLAGETPPDTSIGYGDPTVTGERLPFVAENGADPAVGFDAPEVVGADWEGNPVEIKADGRPKIVIFLAHWCPHCQADVPRVQQWIDAGGVPDGVDLYSVATLTDPVRPKWPPQDWLEEEGWTVPVIMDDAASSVATAYGLVGTPFYVVLDGQNRNLARVSGEIGAAGMDALAEIALDSLD